MATPIYSPTFGGSVSNGIAVSDAGKDCILPIGGDSSPDIWELHQIIATYGIPDAIDFQNPAALYRSFTGRLLVIDGIVRNDFSPAAVPNTALYTALPSTLPGPILFDVLLHSFDKPFIFDFPRGEGIGSIRSNRGHGFSVVLLAGQHYTGAGARAYLSNQMLKVSASKVAISQDITIPLSEGGQLSTRERFGR